MDDEDGFRDILVTLRAGASCVFYLSRSDASHLGARLSAGEPDSTQRISVSFSVSEVNVRYKGRFMRFAREHSARVGEDLLSAAGKPYEVFMESMTEDA